MSGYSYLFHEPFTSVLADTRSQDHDLVLVITWSGFAQGWLCVWWSVHLMEFPWVQTHYLWSQSAVMSRNFGWSPSLILSKIWSTDCMCLLSNRNLRTGTYPFVFSSPVWPYFPFSRPPIHSPPLHIKMFAKVIDPNLMAKIIVKRQPFIDFCYSFLT